MAARRAILETSIGYRLRDGVRFCICSERAVFLDLPADRYFCLPTSVDQAFMRWLGGQADTQTSLDGLVELGVLVEAEDLPAAAQPAHTPRPARDLNGETSTNLFWILWAACEQLLARRRLRRSPFGTLMLALEGLASRSPGVERRAHACVAAAFAGSRLLLHRHDNCLSHSLAFHRACRRLRIDASFVIGVRLDPFSAHCWVQCGDLVLNDSVERVRHYTPIVVA